MIQRIQSIYLLLAAIISIVLIFVPLPYVISGIAGSAFDEALQFDFGKAKLLHVIESIPMAVTAGIIALVSIINIFLFRNRTLQNNICNLNLLLVLVLMGIGIYWAVSDTTFPDYPFYGTLLPVVAYFFIALAKKNIMHDDWLVKSSDRLR